MNIDERYDPLCCCEYFDRNNERNHLLACFCNCVDFDQLFENFICCRSINTSQKTRMFLTFQDRLRIPWRGGAKLISLDIVLPIILIPLILSLSAISIHLTLFLFVLLPIALGYTYTYLTKLLPRTKFFFIWSLWSFILIMIVFQVSVPLYEILPEENFIFVLLFACTILCFYKVKKLSTYYRSSSVNDIENKLSDLNNDSSAVQEMMEDGTAEKENIDNSNDQERLFKRNNSTLKMENYLYWLDASIGQNNRRYFFFGCLFACLTCLLDLNLTMTTICHPYIFAVVFGVVILLPDDCSEVYGLYDISFGYVSALYSLMMTVFILYHILNQARIAIKQSKNKGVGNKFNY